MIELNRFYYYWHMRQTQSGPYLNQFTEQVRVSEQCRTTDTHLHKSTDIGQVSVGNECQPELAESYQHVCYVLMRGF